MVDTASLAGSLTWHGSKQSYFTAHLMADRDLVKDALRAYAYFRWVDDFIDISSRSDPERHSFIQREKELINRLYMHEKPVNLALEEEIVAELISHDRGENRKLQSYIQNMLSLMEFDVGRRGKLITQQNLTWYSKCLGKAVIDNLQYFIGNGHPYPDGGGRYSAAIGAHIAHMLRDMLPDIENGFINIPREYLEANHISPQDFNSPPFRSWVRQRVNLARQLSREGRHYLDTSRNLRYKIVCYWYCARYEGVLDTIERDGYLLRLVYNDRYKPAAWFRIAWLGSSVILQHFIQGRRQKS